MTLPSLPHIPTPSEIAKAVEDAIKGLLATLLDRPLDTVDNVVDRIAETVNKTVASASQAVNNAIDTTGRNVDNAINSATATANRAIDGATNVVNKAIDTASATANRAIDGATGVVNKAIDSASATANRGIDAAERLGNNAINSARGTVDRAIDTAGALGRSAIDGARNVADHAIDVADRRIGQVIQGAKDAVVAVAGDVKSGLENAGKAIENGISRVVNATGQLVSDAIKASENAVGRTIGAASGYVQGVINAASGYVTDIGNRISTNLGVLITQLSAQYDALANNITLWWENTQRYIEDLIRRVSDYVSENFNKAWEWISNEALAYGENVKSNLDSLENGITSIGSKLFSCGYDSYGAVINDIAGLGLDSSLVRVLVYGILGAGMVLAGAPTAAHPYLQCIANIGMQQIRPMSADLATLATAFVRGKPSGGAFGDAAGRQGIPEGQAQSYVETAYNPVPTGTTITGVLRGTIDRSQAEAQLVDAQYYPEYLDQFIAASRPLIGAAEALTAARRGGWTIESAASELSKAGYTEEQSIALRRLTDQLLTYDEYVTAWLREHIDEPMLDQLLYQRGYAKPESDLLKQLAFFVPPPSDLVRMAVREVFSPDIAQKFGQYEDFPDDFAKYAKYNGISEFWAKAYWAAHWDLPSLGQGYEMFQRGIISFSELELLMRAQDVMPFWRDKLVQIAYNPLTRVDVRRMYQLGVLNEDQITQAYLNIGYSPDNAAHLTEFTKRWVAQADANSESKVKELTRAQIETAFIQGIFTKAEALEALKHLNYRSEDAELLLQLAVVRNTSDAAGERYKNHTERTIKSIVAAQSARVISEGTATALLQDMGLTPNEIAREFALSAWERDLEFKDTLISRIRELSIEFTISDTQRDLMLSSLGLLQPEIDGLIQEWNMLKVFRRGKPTRADLRRWVKTQLITLDEYALELRGLGYAEQYVQLYVTEDS